MSAGKGTMLLRMHQKLRIQICHWEQCNLLRNAFEDVKHIFIGYRNKKSRETHKRILSRKNNESGVSHYANFTFFCKVYMEDMIHKLLINNLKKFSLTTIYNFYLKTKMFEVSEYFSANNLPSGVGSLKASLSLPITTPYMK